MVPVHTKARLKKGRAHSDCDIKLALACSRDESIDHMSCRAPDYPTAINKGNV